MKTKEIFITVLLVIFGGFISSCQSETDFSTETPAKSDVDAVLSSMYIQPGETYTGEKLTQAEIDGLMLMREEEKLAQDVYAFFYEKYKLPVFRNIAKSEGVHTAAVLRLLNYFELTDPATADAGVFHSEEMQHLYDELTAKGSTLNDALATGAFIEEYDIADLEKLIKETDKTEIIRVYTNLRRGSINHLNAFVRILKARGVNYAPQVLNNEDFQALIRN